MKKIAFIIVFLFFIYGQNVFALSIHREHSDTYTQELINKNKQDKNDNNDDALIKDIPLMMINNQSSNGYNMPLFTPGATFMIPSK